jgi:large subunit ribosomal protein L4
VAAPKAPILDGAGKKSKDATLEAAVFAAEVKPHLVHEAVRAELNAQRAGSRGLKTRGLVAGGRGKPWRQKGTGRARHGSIRSPIWTGGGVSHGPKPRDHSLRVNKKMKRLALRSALTDRAREGRIKILNAISFDEPSTKDALGVLESLQTEGGTVLLVMAKPDPVVEKSFRNLGEVKIDYPGNVSTYDVLYADWIVFTREALEAVKP